MAFHQRKSGGSVPRSGLRQPCEPAFWSCLARAGRVEQVPV